MKKSRSLLFCLILMFIFTGYVSKEGKSEEKVISETKNIEKKETFLLNTKEKAIQFWESLYESDFSQMPLYFEGTNISNGREKELGDDYIVIDATDPSGGEELSLTYQGVWKFQQIDKDTIEIRVYGKKIIYDEEKKKFKTKKAREEWLVANNYPNGEYLKIRVDLKTKKVLEKEDVS